MSCVATSGAASGPSGAVGSSSPWLVSGGCTTSGVPGSTGVLPTGARPTGHQVSWSESTVQVRPVDRKPSRAATTKYWPGGTDLLQRASPSPATSAPATPWAPVSVTMAPGRRVPWSSGSEADSWYTMPPRVPLAPPGVVPGSMDWPSFRPVEHHVTSPFTTVHVRGSEV